MNEIDDIMKTTIDFSIWLRDNYSTNTIQGGKHPLPKDMWRLDFTNKIFHISKLWELYLDKNN